MNAATLAALLRGDYENAVIAATPGGIEAQEKAGQAELVNNSVLPININGGTKEQFEAIGIVFGDPVDNLFCKVVLPDGWQKKPTEHSMWSTLVDEKGRERASIFYKAAFYDRDAFLNIERRYSYSCDPFGGYEQETIRSAEWRPVAKDGETVIWEGDSIGVEPDVSNHEQWRKWYDIKRYAANDARQWLDQNYPGWEDPTAYWD